MAAFLLQKIWRWITTLKRNIQVIFRVNEAEYGILRQNAAKAKFSQAAYLRSLIMGYVPRQPPSADFYAMTKELRAIGNRMNQIAARANATGFFLAEEYAENARRLFNSIVKIREAVVLPDKMT